MKNLSGKDQAHSLRNHMKNDIALSNSDLTPQIISIASGKGGVGKSNIAVNLAYQCSKQGKRVLLFDADFGLGNTDILLGVNPKYNLSHLMDGTKNIQDITYEINPNLTILATGSANFVLANASTMILDMIFYQLEKYAQSFDLVLIDTGSGIGELVRNTLLFSDRVIVVTSPDPSSLTDSYATIKMVSQRDHSADFSLVVNMVESMKQGKNVYQQLKQVSKKFLDVELNSLGSIPYDKRVEKAIRSQKLISEVYPGSESSLAFEAIAKEIFVKEIQGKKVQLKEMIKGFFVSPKNLATVN